jgi:hypothetical protein
MTQETKVIRQVLEGDIESFRLIVERYERQSRLSLLASQGLLTLRKNKQLKSFAGRQLIRQRDGGFRLWRIFDCDINNSLFVGVISVFFRNGGKVSYDV